MELNKLKNILNFFEKKVNRSLPSYTIRLNLLDPNHKWTEEELNIEGDLNLNSIPITTLPNSLTVGGHLDLTSTPIKSLPNDLEVRGNLYLYNTKIKSLPNDLKVRGTVFISYRKKLENVPLHLKIERW